MPFPTTLFWPVGRATRSQFWNVQMLWVASFVLVIWIATFNKDDEDWNPMRIATTVVFAVMLVLSLWSSLCAGARRLHDRGRSGWWVLFSFVPLVGNLWFFIEAGFMRGQAQDNAYGPAPVGKSWF